MSISITKEDLEFALVKSSNRISTTAKYFGVDRSRIYALVRKFCIQLPEAVMGVTPKYKINNKHVNNIYYKMINRCYSEKNKDYKYYGARGIKVYEPWLKDRELFAEHILSLENNDEKGYSMDRIDNNSDYCPGNIRFVLHKVQCRNRRSNLRIMYKGQEHTLIDLCEAMNLDVTLVSDRVNDGWPVEEALFAKLHARCSISPTDREKNKERI